MGNREKSKAKSISDDDLHSPSKKKSTLVFSDSDDEAANEDLSLKIVEKSKSRAAAQQPEMEAVVPESGGPEKSSGKKKVKKVKKTKGRTDVEADGGAEVVNAVRAEAKVGVIDGVEVTKISREGVENPDNAVLRKLLRGPRYFDPPENSWGACFKCGEDGHTSANCTSVRRRKPCFICGSTEHTVRQCTKAQDCFICNNSSHRAKDCPQKFKKCLKSLEVCLKCGASGHLMLSCNNDYSPDDLKEIQCYVCKGYGHLCCANYFDSIPSEPSCYKCGQTGHTGPGCRTSQGNTNGLPSLSVCYKCGGKGHFARECTNAYASDTTGAEPSLCYRCGGEGHFASQCSHPKKAKKRDRELSTPSKKPVKEGKGKRAVQSAHDAGNAPEKKKIRSDDANFISPRNLKGKGGWTIEHPADYSYRNPGRDYSYGNTSHGNSQTMRNYSHGSKHHHGNSHGGNYYQDFSYGNDNVRRWAPVTPIRDHMVSRLNYGVYHFNSQSYKRADNHYPV
ncbi:DNA-binding protein HEXBP-like protein [Drosera capensis]